MSRKQLTFALVAIFLALGTGSQLLAPPSLRLGYLLVWLVLIPLIFTLTLRFGVTRQNWLAVAALPTVLGAGIFLTPYYFQLLRWQFLLFYAVFAGGLFYLLLLSTNIFLVVTEKGSSIPLLRPAKTVNFLITVVATFIFYTLIYKIPLPFYLQAILGFLATLIVTGQYWWGQQLEKAVKGSYGSETLLIGLIVLEAALALSFIYLDAYFRSLVLTTTFYTALGIFQAIVEHQQLKRVVGEHILVALAVALLLILV